ncbi:hypothetical protein [Pseudokineococcus sp. 1T1Z-3]|uniref:hypothetical protein n=1 Tax=Pseudokineococcus sp. 1T1Z-3 TaxID=3132745 RepID=UPI0030A73EEB
MTRPRMTRPRVTAVALLAVLGLTGCAALPLPGTAETTPSADASPTPPPVPPLDITLNGEQVPVADDGTPEYCATLTVPDGTAKDRFGEEPLRTGLCDVVTLLLAQGATSSFERLDEDVTAEEVVESASFVKGLLTPEAGEWWDERVAGAVADEPGSFTPVALLALARYDDGEYRPATRTGRGYSHSDLVVSRVWLSHPGSDTVHLQVLQSIDLDLVRVEDDTDAWVTVERDFRVDLVPSGDPETPFLVEDWWGVVRYDDLRDVDGRPVGEDA